jgi:hypothetical protein
LARTGLKCVPGRAGLWIGWPEAVTSRPRRWYRAGVGESQIVVTLAFVPGRAGFGLGWPEAVTGREEQGAGLMKS